MLADGQNDGIGGKGFAEFGIVFRIEASAFVIGMFDANELNPGQLAIAADKTFRAALWVELDAFFFCLFELLLALRGGITGISSKDSRLAMWTSVAPARMAVRATSVAVCTAPAEDEAALASEGRQGPLRRSNSA